MSRATTDVRGVGLLDWQMDRLLHGVIQCSLVLSEIEVH